MVGLRARPWSLPPVLDLFPAPGPVLEAVSAPVRSNPLGLAREVLPSPSSIQSAPRGPRR